MGFAFFGYVKKFEIVMAGSNTKFTLNHYDASFEKFELFDFDKDDSDELAVI